MNARLTVRVASLEAEGFTRPDPARLRAAISARLEQALRGSEVECDIRIPGFEVHSSDDVESAAERVVDRIVSDLRARGVVVRQEPA